MKKVFAYSFSIVFLGLLFLPILNTGFNFFEFERKSENRTFHDSITINFNKLDAFPEDCNGYLQDNFEFRTPLIQLFHEIKSSVFHVSPHPENVIIGHNGWNFIAQKEIDIFTGKLNFTSDELHRYKEVWKKRTQYLDSLNIKTCWVICPMTHYIYSEYLPFNYTYYNSESRVETLKKFLAKDFPGLIIDPKNALIEQKNKGQKVYYQNDNHWNHKAGETVVKLLIAKIKALFPNKNIQFPSNYHWLDTIREGGIHKDFLGIETPIYESNQLPVFKNENGISAPQYDVAPPADFPYPDQFQMRFTQQKPINNLRVLIIRDSFGDHCLPFLKEAFGETVFIFDSWKYKLNEDVIQQMKPDLVIFLGLETHMKSFIEH